MEQFHYTLAYETGESLVVRESPIGNIFTGEKTRCTVSPDLTCPMEATREMVFKKSPILIPPAVLRLIPQFKKTPKEIRRRIGEKMKELGISETGGFYAWSMDLERKVVVQAESREEADRKIQSLVQKIRSLIEPLGKKFTFIITPDEEKKGKDQKGEGETEGKYMNVVFEKAA